MFRVVSVAGFLSGKNASPQVKNGHMLAIGTERPLVVGENRVFVASKYTVLETTDNDGNVVEPAVPRELPEEGGTNFDFSDWLEYEIIQVDNQSTALMPIPRTWIADAFPENFPFRRTTGADEEDTGAGPLTEPDGAPPVEVVVVTTDENGNPVGQGEEELPVFP